MTTAELLKTPEDLKGSAGAEAKLGFKAHPHMLRHAPWVRAGVQRHDTRALQGLSRAQEAHGAHTELSLTRFKNFWRA